MTYQTFFNLDEAPFSLVPDPDYYFPSTRHSEALETLRYCVQSGEGFVQITGQPGVGKTVIIRSFLGQLGDNVNTALILHPRLDAEALFKVILEDLGLAPENMQGLSKEALLRSFREILLDSAERGVQTLVIIDEAQEIPDNTLEELRLLSNLETNKAKLLQIILVGQLELEEKLKQERFRQLSQRITIRYRIEPLTFDETVNYIHHRLKVAGGGNISRFGPKIIKEIHRLSGGVPRLVNILCERSLMAAFVDGKYTVTRQHLHTASQSLEPGAVGSRLSSGRGWWLSLAAVLVLAVAATLYFSGPARYLAKTEGQKLAALVHRKVIQTATLAEKDAGEAVAAKKGEKASAEKTKMLASVTPVKPEAGGQEVAGRQTEKAASDAVAPPALDFLPPDWSTVLILRDKNTALVYQGTSHVPVREVALPTDAGLEDGIYLLGEKGGTPFFFNHRSFFPWQMNSSLTELLLKQFDRGIQPQVIPVIVATSASLGVLQHADTSGMRTMVRNWAAAHGDKDIEAVMGYYDDPLIRFSMFQNKPTLMSHAQVEEKKRRVFEKNRAILLQISAPVCLVENSDASRAMVLFHQRFVSSSYQDSGVKVLYLRKVAGGGAEQQEWLITDTLWVPSSEESQQEASE
jgi:type II secretory pathway predicted ATPase ExeA/ketosteroid isomerase-like protein